MLENKSSNTNTYKIENISSLDLKNQAKTICRLKRYIWICTFIEKMLLEINMQSPKNRQKIKSYIKTHNELENKFLNMLRNIAFTLLLEEEEYIEMYLKKGFTKEQLLEVKKWDILESQKRLCQDKEKYLEPSKRKKLEKSVQNIYRSFL